MHVNVHVVNNNLYVERGVEGQISTKNRIFFSVAFLKLFGTSYINPLVCPVLNTFS